VTAESLLVLLDTLWSRAEDIRIDPRARVDLHATLILAGFGFRPGSLMGLRYNQIELRLLRDPKNPGQVISVATITIKQEKKRAKADPRSQPVGARMPLYVPLILLHMRVCY